MGSLRRFFVAMAGSLAVLALAVPAHAAFPGANGKIAFARFSNLPGVPFNYQIYSMSPDGSVQTDLSNAISDDGGANWSPDGRKIAFGRGAPRGDDPNAGPPIGIYLMNADGTGQTQITNGYDGAPAWSPDGSKIAFSSCGATVCDLLTMNADGTSRTTIRNDFYDTSPVWSPDGSKIVFSRCVVSGFSHGSVSFSECHIATVRPDGTGQTDLTSGSGRDFAPDWSPDATKIAFMRFGSQGPSQIYTINADGSDETLLSAEPTVGDAAPAWSPDGSKIAFTHYVQGRGQIYTMRPDGSAPTNLSNSTTDDTGPDWQPIPGPQRSEYKNAAQFCQADRTFLGDAAFAKKYGTNGSAANAYGKCVSQSH